jgi:hypothetical protein
VSDAFGYGQVGPDDGASDLNAIARVVKQIIARMDIMKLVKVVAVHPGTGSPASPATVDVLPLVSQIDGNGYAVAHGTIFGLQCWRFQFGPWAIIADPAVGDVGYVICADRDSSTVAKNLGQSVTPGSRRRYNVADGVYVGGCLNAVPAATIWLKSDGTLAFADKPGNVLQTSATGIAVTTAAGGDFTVNGISATMHTHAVTAAPGETGPPVG